jgi:hypothetical protein
LAIWVWSVPLNNSFLSPSVQFAEKSLFSQEIGVERASGAKQAAEKGPFGDGNRD